MFLHLSVSHSVHRGSGIPACIAGGIQACLSAGLGGGVSQHALQISRPTFRGKMRGLARGVSRPTPKSEVDGSCLGGLQAHTGVQGGLRPTPKGGVSQHAVRQAPDGYCCGRYTSYWNAFLFRLCVKCI